MSKGSKIGVAVLLGLIALFALLFLPVTQDRRVEAKLRELEYWERMVSGQSTRSDWLFRRLWANLMGKQQDSVLESMNCREELIRLGFLERHTFMLSTPATNSADFATFYKAVMAAPLTDMHWSYSTHTNRVEVMIARKDRQAWENIVNSWDARRRNAAATNKQADLIRN